MERRRRKKQTLSNQTLLALIGILSVVLVVLLVICGTVLEPQNPSGGDISMNGSETPGTMPSGSQGTQPSSQMPTKPTIPQETIPPAPTTPPLEGDYVNVGSGYIVEVVQANVESFDSDTLDDYSHPTNNYLPEGTVDYCAKDLIYANGLKYVQLRSGHRVYYDKKVYPHPERPYARMVKEVKQYEGWLPDHNEIGVASFDTVGHHSVLTLNTLWKAPFYFSTNQSGYVNPNGGSGRDYAVVNCNIGYVDITFCYATVFTGQVDIPANHPLFKSAEVFKNASDYTLRLYLRKTGGFYGWHAYYNANGQLCFQFLNPQKATAANNKYGANLTGIRVMIDVGHGGVDGGASATDAQGTLRTEAECNLALANALKKELESMGATVILNRADNSAIHVNDRQKQLLDIAPDICVAVHQNSYATDAAKGFDAMYYHPWSMQLAKNVHQYTENSGIYAKTWLKWKANYFMTRQTICPTILTENGYMSNPSDLNGMIDPAIVEAKAVAIAHGIADYFLTIS